MFNMLLFVVSAKVAEYCGLFRRPTDLLTKPVAHATFAWRLPCNGLARQHTSEGRLPQGLAGSVLMAKLAIAPLL